MFTELLSTLKIHKLTQSQYYRELDAGNIDESALYLTPEEEIDLSGYATVEQVNEAKNYTDNAVANKAETNHIHAISDVAELQNELDSKSVSFTRSLTRGTKIGTITINNADTALYAPTPTMNREFDSGLVDNGTSFSYAGTNSKFYIVTYGNTDFTYISTITVDYRAILAGLTEYNLGNEGVLKVLMSDNGISFTVENLRLWHVCGYY